MNRRVAPFAVGTADLQTAGRLVLAKDRQAAVVVMGAVAQLPRRRRLGLIGVVDEAQRQRRVGVGGVEMVFGQIECKRRHAHQPAGEQAHGVEPGVHGVGQRRRLRGPEVRPARAAPFLVDRRENQRLAQVRGRRAAERCSHALDAERQVAAGLGLLGRCAASLARLRQGEEGLDLVVGTPHERVVDAVVDDRRKAVRLERVAKGPGDAKPRDRIADDEGRHVDQRHTGGIQGGRLRRWKLPSVAEQRAGK